MGPSSESHEVNATISVVSATTGNGHGAKQVPASHEPATVRAPTPTYIGTASLQPQALVFRV